MNFVVFANGIVILFSAVLMGIDALVFPDTAGVFGRSCVLAGTLGGVLVIAASSSSAELHRIKTFLLTSSVWLTAALIGALPLHLWALSPVDALFEAMSGVTTTGSTVMTGLDTTPKGILMWRAILQALGGVGFIVTGMALLPILRVGGMQLFRTESSDRGEKELRNAAFFAGATLSIYLGLLVLCSVTYMLGGMSFFDGVTHAMTTLSTGGYSNYDASFGHFKSPFLQWAGTGFMLLGALPFAWYIRVYSRGTYRSEQVTLMLWSLGIVIAVLTLWMIATRDVSALAALRLVAFNVVSVVTTTGYATDDYTGWGSFAVIAFFMLTAVGGCTGSTAGGAKAMRWILFARSVVARVKQIHHPHGVFVIRYEGRVVSDEALNGVLSFFIFYFLTVAGLAVLLDLAGLDFSTAVSGALTAVANVGPGVGGIIGPAGNFASLNDLSKGLLAFGMYLGRLEMVTVFVLLTPAFWREV